MNNDIGVLSLHIQEILNKIAIENKTQPGCVLFS